MKPGYFDPAIHLAWYTDTNSKHILDRERALKERWKLKIAAIRKKKKALGLSVGR